MKLGGRFLDRPLPFFDRPIDTRGHLLILNRQKMLLFLLRMAGGEASKIQMMKWSFLISEASPNRGGDSFYEFLPYRFGPYSFSLENEMIHLRRQGLVRLLQAKRIWRLTPHGVNEAKGLRDRLSQDVDHIMRTYGFLKTDDLIDHVYAKHPWFTINCDAMEKRALKRPKAYEKIYTIGYSGFSIDGFLNRLMRVGIFRLIDVRSNPSSRKYGFSKTRLSGLCASVGIEYKSFPELGIPHEQRRNAHSDSEYHKLFNSYRRDITVQQDEAITTVYSLLQQKPSILMCVESNPEQCHRSHLAKLISDKGIDDISHIGLI